MQSHAPPQSVYFQVMQSVLLSGTYIAQCPEGEAADHHIEKTLFDGLNEETSESVDPRMFLLAVAEVKDGAVDAHGDAFDAASRVVPARRDCQPQLHSDRDSDTECTAEGIEAARASTVCFNVEAVESALAFLNAREYSAFQSLLKLRACPRVTAGAELERRVAS
jgi:hypothetical protein